MLARFANPGPRRDHSRLRRGPVGGGNGGGGDDLAPDPLLIALLKKTPTSGDWPALQRLRWFRTFAMNVSQIYDEEALEPVELKIDLEAAN